MSGEYVLNQSIFRVPSAYDDEVSLGGLGDFGLFGLHGLGDVASGSAAVDALVNKVDADLAVKVRPLWGAIDASPLPADQKQLFKTRPLIFLLQSVRVVKNLASEIVVETNKMSNRWTRVWGVPGAMLTMDMNPRPESDAQLPTEALRQLMWDIRLIGQFAILMLQVPPILAAATAKVFAKYAIQGGEMLANFIRDPARNVAAAGAALAQDLATGAQSAAQAAASGAQSAVQAAASGAQSAAQTAATGIQTGIQTGLRNFGLRGLGAPPAAAGAGIGATLWTAAVEISKLVLPAVAVALIGGIFALLTGVITTQMKQSGVTPGSERPGPDGSTDGVWIDGKWYPRDTPKVDLKTTLLSPPVIGAIIGGLFLLYVNSQKRG